MSNKEMPTSRVSDDKAKLVANAVAESAKAGRAATITGMSAANLLRAISRVPADKTEFTVHRKGLYIQIGTRFNNIESAKYALSVDIKPDLVFQVNTKYLVAALEQIPADGEGVLSFSEHKDPIVGVRIGDYTYAMSSTVPAAERA